MKRWLCLGLTVLCIATGLLFISLLFSPAEPSYQGKRFSVWLEHLCHSPAEKADPVAVDAIEHIGTNALPCMIRMLTAKDSFIKRQAIKLAGMQSVFRIHVTEARFTREFAVTAFLLYGAQAQPAVPSLVEILKTGDRYDKIESLRALAAIGPSASNAIPAITKLLNDDDELFLEEVRSALSAIQTTERQSQPRVN